MAFKALNCPRKFSWLTLVITSVMLVACENPSNGLPTDAEVEEWVSLFTGESLEGWSPKIRGEEFGEDARNTFRVEDGAITVSYDEYGVFSEQFGHLFHETPYEYYRLRYTYRFFGEQMDDGPGWAWRNSGIMIHSPAGATMGVDQDFPISIEVQLLGGNGTDERTTANLCTPGTNVVISGELETRHCISSTSATYHGDDWVSGEILALGDSLIVHMIEGQEVLAYTHPQMGGGSVSGHDESIKVDGRLLAGGYFSLQSESHPVQYKDLEILNLKGCMDADSPAFKSYFIVNDPSSCEQ
jgi:hypothetical protein